MNPNQQIYPNNFMFQGYFPQMPIPYMAPQFYMNMGMPPQQPMMFYTPNGLSQSNMPNMNMNMNNKPLNDTNCFNSSCPNLQIGKTE